MEPLPSISRIQVPLRKMPIRFVPVPSQSAVTARSVALPKTVVETSLGDVPGIGINELLALVTVGKSEFERRRDFSDEAGQDFRRRVLRAPGDGEIAGTCLTANDH